MGILRSIFGNKNSEENRANDAIHWIPLTASEQLNSIVTSSSDRLQFIFKHSTNCGISNMVLRLFKENYALDAEKADFYYLDLHRYRNVSDEVASKFEVHHQSPQLLVIKNGVVVDHNSHGGITDMDVSKYL
jgi:bacillithiol system protein YtxJ